MTGTACAVDWAAFGLADPDDVPCPVPAVVVVTQGCIHEHVARSLACYGHLAEMLSYEGQPGDWMCGPCAAAGHEVGAPLGIKELHPGAAGTVPDGLRDFDRYCADNRIGRGEEGAAFGAWLNEASGGEWDGRVERVGEEGSRS